MADQGNAGNGAVGTGEAQGQGLHEQFVSNAPEHLRDAARELVPHWDQYVQRQFTDNADYRKQWEPFEQLGINQLDPGELQELLEFRDIVSDEDKFREWHRDVGELLGGDENGAGEDEFDDPALSQMKQQMDQMQQFMQQMAQDREMQQQQQAFQQTAMQVRQELDGLKKDNPDLTEEDEDYICTLALKYDSEDAIKRGFQDFQKLMGRAEQGVFKSKETDPSLRVAPVGGGNNDTSTEPVTTFEQAARAARERMRQNT
jgi:DNA repair ATPase RecN